MSVRSAGHRGLSLSGVLLAALTVLIWGAQLMVAKRTFGSVDPLHGTALRYCVAAAVLAPLLAWREGVGALNWSGRAPLAWTLGILGMTLSPALVFGGLQFTRPEVAAVIIALQPAITALAQRIFLGRRIQRFTLACIGVAFLGVLAVVTRGQAALSGREGELVGDAMVLAGAACWVAYTMGAERFAGWSNLRLTTLTVLPGTAGAISLAAFAQALGWAQLPDLKAWLSVGWELAYLALLGVLLSMLMWNAAARRLGALNAMLFLNAMPVVTFAIRAALGRQFVPIELAGVAMVVGALVANNLHLRWHAPRSR